MKTIRTQQEIDKFIILLEENKKNSRSKTAFGDDCHNAIDCMITTLREGYDEHQVYSSDWNKYSEDAAMSVIEWKQDADIIIEDLLYPTK